MTKNDVTKFVVKLAVSTAVSSLVTRVLVATVPATVNYKVADMTGVLAGWYTGEKLEPQINAAVDNFFAKRKA